MSDSSNILLFNQVNDVRFVAHPTYMQSILINIVFALHAQASYSIVKCYYELSKRLGHALVYEESRVGYLSDEMKLMAKIHDEIATNSAESENIFQSLSAFDLILEQSSLAQCLKSVRASMYLCKECIGRFSWNWKLTSLHCINYTLFVAA